jgi:transcriptional regulator with XRE-family HTH domain
MKQNPMNFARELAEMMAGPPRMSQTALAKRSRMLKSKISRILNSQTPVDKQTLDAILRAFPEKRNCARLVAAFVCDAVSENALSHVRLEGRIGDGDFAVGNLSVKGQAATKFLLRSKAHVRDFERILISLARAWGYRVR